jgi:hypothetical protein
MASGIGFGRAGHRAGRSGPGWATLCLGQLICLLLLCSGLRADPGFCTSVNLTDEGLLDTGEPCGQSSPVQTDALDTPQFPVYSDPVNLALGGATNVFGIGVTALQNNPAGMAQIKQYAFSLGYGYHGQPENHAFTLAATDSLTNPHMAGGFMYSYQRVGANVGGRETYGTAQRMRGGLTLSERWQNMSFHLGGAAQLDKEEVGTLDRSLWNVDVGILFVAYQMLRVGGVMQRVIDQSDEGRPSRVGGGLGFGTGPVQLEYDIYARMGDDDEKFVTHSVGVQAAPQARLPIRLGYRSQPSTDFQAVSGGLGFVFLQGGVDASYAHELGGQNRRWVVVQLRLFLGH